MPSIPSATPAEYARRLRRRQLLPAALLSTSLLMLGGCTWYHRKPLSFEETDTSARQLPRLRIDPATMPLPELAAHRFDPSGGLDIEDVAMLAVANNPALKLARDDLHLATAQAFAAGLLPDPQLNIAQDYPGAVGAVSAFSYGLSMDVMSVVASGATKASADANVTKVDLGLLWDEWQTIAQARQLFVKSRFQADTLPLLRRQHDLAQQRYERMSEAMRAGNVTANALTAALVAWSDAGRQLSEAERAAQQTHHDLNALLGLSQDVELSLTGTPQLHLDDDTIDAALKALPRRRPDLLALQAGYESQEQKYRAAVISQFPSLTVGFVRARDTTPIYTSGFQINLSLPIFNRNRGNVAIERATRRRLHDDYQDRLNQAYADVAQMRADDAILSRQLRELQAALPGVERAAREAATAYSEHNLVLGTYVDAQSAALTKQIDIATVRESLEEQRIGLQALLGNAIPDAFSLTSSLQTPAVHHAN